jgi:RNA polymerase sigma-70 factor (ECF subfamily)
MNVGAFQWLVVSVPWRYRTWADNGWHATKRPLAAVPDADQQLEIQDQAAIVANLQNTEAQYLFGYVRRLGLSDDQADDAVQEVFARLLRELRGDGVIANPRAWAYRSIYRLAMDHYRLRRRIAAVVDALARRPPRPTIDDADRIAVWTEVDRLTARQRSVIYLRYRSDLTFDEIAETLGISPSSARSHATQAMATLRQRLADSIQERR